VEYEPLRVPHRTDAEIAEMPDKELGALIGAIGDTIASIRDQLRTDMREGQPRGQEWRERALLAIDHYRMERRPYQREMETRREPAKVAKKAMRQERALALNEQSRKQKRNAAFVEAARGMLDADTFAAILTAAQREQSP